MECDVRLRQHFKSALHITVSTLICCPSQLVLAANTQPVPSAPTAGNVFAPDQQHYGNWTATQYIAKGWTGYHVISEVKQINNWVDYEYTTTTSCGKSTCTETHHDWYGPYCKDGYCDKTMKTVVYKIGNSDVQGSRDAANEIIGKVNLQRSAATGKTEIQGANGINIGLITRQSAMSRLGFEESDVTNYTGFTKAGLPVDLGHVEGAHGSKIYNQVNSYYEGIGDNFLMSTIHKVLMGRADDHEDPGFRIGTLWCKNDKYKMSRGLMSMVTNDKYDFKECRDTMPMDSRTSDWGKQSYSGRTDSDVNLRDPDDASKGAKYRVDTKLSNMWFLGGLSNGTRYGLQIGRQIAFYFDSEVYNSLSTTPDLDWGVTNQPKIKFLSVNWNHDEKFTPVTSAKKYLDSNPVVTAALVHDEMGEFPVKLDGNYCTANNYHGFKGKYEDPAIQKLSSEKAFVACHRKQNYTLHYYILFPPLINGKKLSSVEQLALLDHILATIPDQAELSPELHAGEEYIDQIRAMERVNITKDPTTIDLPLMTDIDSTEDALSGPQKAWDMLSDLQILHPRQSRVDADVVAIQNTSVAQPQRGATHDRTDY